jgi:hypothetical protein
MSDGRDRGGGAGDIINPSRKIAGDYSLENLDSGLAYYLCVKGPRRVLGLAEEHCGGESDGVFDGAVEQIGWTNEYVVVLLDGPAKAGWRIVEVKSGRVEGPLMDTAFAFAQKSRPALGQIEILKSGDA